MTSFEDDAAALRREREAESAQALAWARIGGSPRDPVLHVPPPPIADDIAAFVRLWPRKDRKPGGGWTTAWVYTGPDGSARINVGLAGHAPQGRFGRTTRPGGQFQTVVNVIKPGGRDDPIEYFTITRAGLILGSETSWRDWARSRCLAMVG